MPVDSNIEKVINLVDMIDNLKRIDKIRNTLIRRSLFFS